MKVALAHDHLNQAGGAERVLKVLTELYSDAPIYTLLHDARALDGMFPAERITSSFLGELPFSRSLFKFLLPLMPVAVESLQLGEPDCLITSASALIKGIVTSPKTLHLCYCHTPTRYLWSDAHQYLEELHYPKFFKRLIPLVLSRLRMWDWHAAQHVDRFVANSHFVAGRIRKYYHREASVIYPPVDVEAFAGSPLPTERGRYFLLIARLRPYKRIDVAVTAFTKMNIPLVIIGTGEEELRLRARAQENITFVGAVSEQEKRRWLSGARALIHPQEEDFGITAVEAMAAGRPVIAYGAGGALETVVPGLSGVLFDEQCWEGLADSVIRFDDGQFDAAKIREHARQFSRERFVSEFSAFVNHSWQEFQQGKGRV